MLTFPRSSVCPDGFVSFNVIVMFAVPLELETSESEVLTIPPDRTLNMYSYTVMVSTVAFALVAAKEPVVSANLTFETGTINPPYTRAGASKTAATTTRIPAARNSFFLDRTGALGADISRRPGVRTELCVVLPSHC